MSKIKNICLYFQNNKLVYCINNDYGTISFKSIKNSKISNLELFNSEFSKFIRSQGLNNNLFGDTIYYLSIADSNIELYLIREIFHRFSFKNVIITDIMDILKENSYIISLKKNYIFINNGEKHIIPKIYKDILLDIFANIEYKKVYIVGDTDINNDIENAYSIYTPEDFLLTKLKSYLKM